MVCNSILFAAPRITSGEYFSYTAAALYAIGALCAFFGLHILRNRNEPAKPPTRQQRIAAAIVYLCIAAMALFALIVDVLRNK